VWQEDDPELTSSEDEGSGEAESQDFNSQDSRAAMYAAYHAAAAAVGGGEAEGGVRKAISF